MLGVLALALSVLAAPPPAIGRILDAGRAGDPKLRFEQLYSPSTWQPAVDIIAKQIGGFRDWKTANGKLWSALGGIGHGGVLGPEFNWHDRKSVLSVGGAHPGLLGYAWVDLWHVPDSRGVTALQCLLWFERTKNRWRGQLLYVGAPARDYFVSSLEPHDALTTRDLLAVVGRIVDPISIAPTGTFTFYRQGATWKMVGRSSSVEESHTIYFGRTRGRKSVDRVFFLTRESLNMIAQSHSGAKRYYLKESRLVYGVYNYYTTKPVPSAISALDDMIWYADNGAPESLRKRCADPTLARRFVALLKRVPGNHTYGPTYHFEGDKQVGDKETQFELEGTGTLLRFRHGARGWALASMRRVR